MKMKMKLKQTENQENTIKYSNDEVTKSFFKSWSDGDIDDIKSTLLIVLQRFGASKVSFLTGLSKKTLYDMCDDNSNPPLANLCKVMGFVKQQHTGI